MAPVAFLFPGQGSQKVGMGKELFESSAHARDIFVRANNALGFSLTDIMFDGAEDILTQTHYAQPAILTHSIAALAAFSAIDQTVPDYVAGHSLGEYSALVAASVLSIEDAVKAVHLRGQLMQEATPAGLGAMAAILGAKPSDIENICKEVQSALPDECIEVANYNGPDQTVISGTKVGVEAACEQLKQQGAKRVIPLTVSAPFHCRLMKPAADRLASHLSTLTFRAPRFGFINNVAADLESDPLKIRDLLVEQVTAPVKFTQMLAKLESLGVRHFTEFGPGKVLSGIVRRTLSDVEVQNKEK